MKRITLFVGYNNTKNVPDYVVYWVKKLSEISDVFYFCDNDVSNIDLTPLDPYVLYKGGTRHQKYDFGSWDKLFDIIGDNLGSYDQLLLINDSTYGPFYSLSFVFDSMLSKNIDFWGMSKSYEINPHLQSFFLVFNRNVFINPKFRNYFRSDKLKLTYEECVTFFEVPLLTYLESLGYKSGAFIDSNQIKSYPINSTRYWESLLDLKCPLIKRKIFNKRGFSKERKWFKFFKLKKLFPDESYLLSLIQKDLGKHYFF